MVSDDFESYAYFPDSLLYVSPELQNDRGVVLAAVAQNWFALEYASRELQKDRDFIFAAVKEIGHALRYSKESGKLSHRRYEKT